MLSFERFHFHTYLPTVDSLTDPIFEGVHGFIPSSTLYPNPRKDRTVIYHYYSRISPTSIILIHFGGCRLAMLPASRVFFSSGCQRWSQEEPGGLRLRGASGLLQRSRKLPGPSKHRPRGVQGWCWMGEMILTKYGGMIPGMIVQYTYIYIYIYIHIQTRPDQTRPYHTIHMVILLILKMTVFSMGWFLKRCTWAPGSAGPGSLLGAHALHGQRKVSRWRDPVEGWQFLVGQCWSL